MSDGQTTDQSILPANQTAKIDKHDIWILVAIGLVSMALLVGFWVWLHTSGLIDYPAAQAIDADSPFHKDILAYRERRVALAMLLRTFITAFSFIVGIVMTTYGGLFILRQVVSLTTIRASFGANGDADVEARKIDAASETAKRQVDFTAYSPGVVFMLGGVVVMIVTQYLAIQVQTPELIPNPYISYCEHAETRQMVPCQIVGADAETVENWLMFGTIPPPSAPAADDPVAGEPTAPDTPLQEEPVTFGFQPDNAAIDQE